jgi:tripartite-type tricarboxylate transporter receptor subunit TctC
VKPRSFFLVAAVWTIALVSVGAYAQGSYPNQPIRFIVPYTAGGGVDKVARTIGDKLTRSLSVPVVIDNRGGAAGNIGTNIASKSDPNGYTMMMGAAALAINVSLYKSLPFDPIKDFQPVVLVAKTPNIVVVNPRLPVKTLKDLIRLAKSKPGVLNYASAGNGTTPHLAAELLDSLADIKMTHVPYKGSAPAVTAIVGGEVDVMISPALTVLPFIKSGALRALATTGAKRSPAFPDIPTMSEAGLPDYEASQWYGILVPAGTPIEIVNRLNREIIKITQSPEVREIFESDGSEVMADSPEQFSQFLKLEIARWSKVIKAEDKLN